MAYEVAVKTWLRRIRGALGMGLTWAIAGFVAGMGIELIQNIWPNPLGGRRRRFDELSLPGVAVWGAVGGLLVSLIPPAIVAFGLATPNVPSWQITVALLGPLTLGGAIAASGSLALARMAEDRDLLDDSRHVADVGLTEDEERELLGGEG